MAFVPFTKDEQPTMAAFNEKFEQAIQQATQQAIAAAGKIEARTWVGTGTYGASNPTVFALGFEPLVAFTYYDADSDLLDDAVGRMAAAIPLFLLPKDNKYHAGFNLQTDGNDKAFAKKSTDGKTLSFYNTGSASGQANYAGWQYGILFIG